MLVLPFLQMNLIQVLLSMWAMAARNSLWLTIPGVQKKEKRNCYGWYLDKVSWRQTSFGISADGREFFLYKFSLKWKTRMKYENLNDRNTCAVLLLILIVWGSCVEVIMNNASWPTTVDAVCHHRRISQLGRLSNIHLSVYAYIDGAIQQVHSFLQTNLYTV